MLIVPENHLARMDPEPEIAETVNALEVPLTGFVCHVRLDTVRLIGYITRGQGRAADRDNTLIVHMPKTGFRRSMAYAIARWNEAIRSAH